MKKVLLAVDETKGSKAALNTFLDLFSCMRPDTVILLNVQQFGGKSVLHDRISDTDISVLLEVVKGTEIQELLDKKSKDILESCKKLLEDNGVKGIKTVIKAGHPAEEILKTVKEEGAGMIIMGSKGKRMHTVLLGSISREVVNSAEVPVLIAR